MISTLYQEFTWIQMGYMKLISFHQYPISKKIFKARLWSPEFETVLVFVKIP